MLFNSFEFIFVFLPVVVAAFYLLGRASPSAALAWLIVASVAFYALWRPLNVLLIAPSIGVNFLIARALAGAGSDDRARAKLLLTVGIVFNVCFLGYFKYRGFAAEALNDAFDAGLRVSDVLLPLGISFITFQKIAFLVDVYGGRVRSFTLRDYCLFVFFFPQLVAGPIVHYREMMPQFQRLDARVRATDLAVGLTLFAFGLFKKVVLADGIAPQVSPIYLQAAGSGDVSLIAAWVAAVGFTLQIYFDFSGYSDMALGLGRCFGIRLPANFDSPLRASSVIDYWNRWHMTLTRFLTAYVYNPMSMALTRRRLAAGRGSGFRGMSPGAFVLLLGVPTFVTMGISGLWHGAAYTFVLWGLLHGLYLTVNHAWRVAVVPRFADRERYERNMRPLGWALTFLAVVVAMVLFRAPSLAAAADVYAGMLGLNGVVVPGVVHGALGAAADALGVRAAGEGEWGSVREFVVSTGWTGILLGVALLLPNSLRVLQAYEPAMDLRSDGAAAVIGPLARVLWRPTLPWALLVAGLGAVAVMRLRGPSEFLYWQF